MTLWRGEMGKRLGRKLRSSTVETSTLTEEGGVRHSLSHQLGKAVLLSRDIAKPVFLAAHSRGRARGGRKR